MAERQQMNIRQLAHIMAALIAMLLFGSDAPSPAAAQCGAFVTLNSAIIYRNWVIVTYDNNTAATQITFIASTTADGVVGSRTIPAAVGTGLITEFALNEALVGQEEWVMIEAVPNADCGSTILWMALGLYNIPASGGTGASAGENPAGCRDGRLNYMHCDKIALYPEQNDDGIDLSVWVVEPDGIGKWALRVPGAALKQGTNTDTLLDESADGKVRVFRLAGGGVQVNYGPDADGKVFIFRFENWPANSYPDVSTYIAERL